MGKAKFLSMLGMAIGFVGTIVTSIAEDRELDSKVEKAVKKCLKKATEEEE